MAGPILPQWPKLSPSAPWLPPGQLLYGTASRSAVFEAFAKAFDLLEILAAALLLADFDSEAAALLLLFS